MKSNLGVADRIIRLIIAGLVAYLYFTGILTGTIGLVMIIAAGVLALTSVISFCPLYAILGISSCSVKVKNQ